MISQRSLSRVVAAIEKYGAAELMVKCGLGSEDWQ
jgi:hypothetical protein